MTLAFASMLRRVWNSSSVVAIDKNWFYERQQREKKSNVMAILTAEIPIPKWSGQSDAIIPWLLPWIFHFGTGISHQNGN